MNSSFVERCFGTNSQESTCPERTYFLVSPLILFWITLPFQVITMRTKIERARNFTRSVNLRIFLILILIGIAKWKIFETYSSQDISNWLSYAPYLFLAISLISILISFVTTVALGHRSNGYVYVTFLFLLIFHSTALIGDLIDKSLDEIKGNLVVNVIVLLLVNILNCTNDTKADDIEEDRCPEDITPLFGLIFLSWLNDLIDLGRRKTLTFDDIYPLSPQNKSEFLIGKWRNVWNKLLEDNQDIHGNGSYRRISSPSISTALFRILGRRVGFAIGMRFLSIFLLFMCPILLTNLLDFVSNPSAPLSYGIAIAISMFVLAEVSSLLTHVSSYQASKAAIHVQSTLSNAVFQKTLRLSAASRSSRTVGELINFMAVDVDNICEVFFKIVDGFSCPFQVLLAMALLYTTIGWVAIPGSLFVFLFIPLNYITSIVIERYQTKQMDVKDERTKISAEVLNGIKLIKLYAWEEAFERRINGLRKNEVQHLVKLNIFAKVADAANAGAPFLVAVITFGCFIFFEKDKVLTPQIAFVCIAIFNQMCIPMRLIAEFVTFSVLANVSRKRLDGFLNEDEINEFQIQKATEGFSLQIHEGNFNWTGHEIRPDIKNINMNMRTGDFVTIVGTVGSGKSSVLSAIIGEMHTISGSISYTGTIAYVPQQAWILNTTLRENILFGKEFIHELYTKVVNAAELESDFAEMEYGDMTEIGENGVTLSGGQKARVSLARSLYQEADIYLLDDCLSAVDAHVGAAVFEKAFSKEGFLKTKTRILVTHGLQYTKTSDRIFVMHDGTFAEEGDYENLLNSRGLFWELARKKEDENAVEETLKTDESGKVIERRRSHRLSTSECTTGEIDLIRESDESGQLIKEETVETGQVKQGVYGLYIRAATYKWSLIFISLHIVHMLLTVLRSIWMSEWTNEHQSAEKEDPLRRLVVYIAIGLIEVISMMLTHFTLVKCCQNASFGLHAPLLHSILRSPMKFFDTTPIGRILNRICHDIEKIDVQLPETTSLFFECVFSVTLILTLISYSTPGFILAVIPLICISIHIYRICLPATRQMRREESVARSPILSKYGECIQGISSIRAYRKIEETCGDYFVANDRLARCCYSLYAARRWMAIRHELIGCFTIFLAALFAVIFTRISNLSPGVVGMSVSYAFTFSEELFYAMCMLSQLETSAVAVERVNEYSHLEEEPEWHSPNPPPKNWPQKGEIEWKNFSTRYRPELPLIINNISVSTGVAEKVGVVGRTGSGKSSLTLAVYRLIEAVEGTIFIDGVDISKIGLHELRSKLTIIPQDPVLFSGSLRFNLDPFEEYTDDELWNALDQCQLRDYVSSQSEKLELEISEGGQNMSVGQRQLVCLGRALLRKGKILILDEATAACDVQTDSFVQKVIREKFDSSTVIAIAHRLNTIENYDRILVLDNGTVAEFDRPQSLLANPDSLYRKLILKAKKHD